MRLLYEDYTEFALSFPLVDLLNESTFLITGATGLIGSTLVRCLLTLNKNISITCPVRNLQKAKLFYGEDFYKVNFVDFDSIRKLSEKDVFDYIIHCASPTEGAYMYNHPVETFELIIESTRLLLEHAKKTNIKGMVYLSSVEYYGQILDDRIITEETIGYIDPLNPRNSYPLGKRAAEFLCTSYAKEYNVNVMCARLTQTFGAGVSLNDNRVFSQFVKSIILGTDIVLHTEGVSAKPYCYTTDCVSALLFILLKGNKGEAYNVANADTYISIKDMAYFLKNNFNPTISIVYENRALGYAPTTKLNLSVNKLMSLGWKPSKDLLEMFESLICYMRELLKNK